MNARYIVFLVTCSVVHVSLVQADGASAESHLVADNVKQFSRLNETAFEFCERLERILAPCDCGLVVNDVTLFSQILMLHCKENAMASKVVRELQQDMYAAEIQPEALDIDQSELAVREWLEASQIPLPPRDNSAIRHLRRLGRRWGIDVAIRRDSQSASADEIEAAQLRILRMRHSGEVDEERIERIVKDYVELHGIPETNFDSAILAATAISLTAHRLAESVPTARPRFVKLAERNYGVKGADLWKHIERPDDVLVEQFAKAVVGYSNALKGPEGVEAFEQLTIAANKVADSVLHPDQIEAICQIADQHRDSKTITSICMSILSNDWSEVGDRYVIRRALEADSHNRASILAAVRQRAMNLDSEQLWQIVSSIDGEAEFKIMLTEIAGRASIGQKGATEVLVKLSRDANRASKRIMAFDELSMLTIAQRVEPQTLIGIMRNEDGDTKIEMIKCMARAGRDEQIDKYLFEILEGEYPLPAKKAALEAIRLTPRRGAKYEEIDRQRFARIQSAAAGDEELLRSFDAKKLKYEAGLAERR